MFLKKIILALAIASSLNALSQSVINLKDSTYTWYGDTATNVWQKPKRTIYAYNGSYQEIGFVNTDSISGSWTNTNNCTSYSYDSNGNLLNQTFQDWNGSTWVNNYQIINTFDGSNNKLTEITQYWDSSSSVWMNGQKITYTYDNFNNKLSDLKQNWDPSSSTWYDYEYFDWNIYTYDSNHNLITTLTKRWSNMNGAWMNYNKDSASYNLNNECTSLLTQHWNGSWYNYLKKTNFVYSSGDLMNYELHLWNGNAFVPQTKWQNLYTNHKIITSIIKGWDSSSSTWKDAIKKDYTYDINGNQITYTNLQWYNGSWVKFERVHDYYKDPSNLCLANASFSLFEDSVNQGNYFAYNLSSGTGALSYLWDFGDGTISNLQYPFHQYVTPGNYIICLTVTASSGTTTCSDTYCDSSSVQRIAAGFLMSQISVIPQFTGIKQIKSLTNIRVYPNPMETELTIEAGSENIHYDLIDALGRIICSGSTQESGTTIYTEHLAKGFYNLSISNKDRSILKSIKLIK